MLALTPHSVAVVLQHIVPPSQLSPLPPYLLSSSLLQRHHFLHISPDQPVSYLAWPSDSGHHHTAVRLLENFQCPIDERLYASFPIRYTTDPESAYAHVSISTEHYSPGIRLVFQWNTPDGWKYHNLALMPFPPNSFESLQEALQHFPVETDDQVDSYWDAYPASDDSQLVPPIKVADTDSQHAAEDSYWSQYATIHGMYMSIELVLRPFTLVTGSGDSTLPTPPSPQKQLKRVLMPYPGPAPATVFNPLEPPSPRALARRLADLGHRPQSPSQLGDVKSELVPDSPVLSPPQHSLLPTSNPSPSDAYQQEAQRTEPGHESHEALKDAIRGLHRLWRLTRQECSVTQSEEQQEFLEIVREVVSEPSLS
jgi:hypothetical protein